MAFENEAPTKKTTQGQHPANREEYYRIVMQQLRELWGNYGPLGEIWFDSGTPFNNNATFQKAIADLTAELQPNTILLQGPDTTNAARKGNGETGTVHDPNWYTCKSSMACRGGKVGGSGSFIPAEGEGCAVGDGNSRQWFWHPDHDEHAKRKPLSKFWNEYHNSVGLGSNYLIGFTADRTGNVPADDLHKFTAFGDLVKACYGTPVATTPAATLTSATDQVVLTLDANTAIDRMWVREDITSGQRVLAFEVLVQESKGGAFSVVFKGSSMGRKRIVRFGKSYTPAAIAVRASNSHEYPVPILQVAAFQPCNDPK